MEPNDKSSPESRQKELLDIAYNIVPEGADYDVFSENTSKEIKPTLIYSEVPSESAEIVQKTEQENEEKRENGGEPYDMFAENADTVKNPDKNVNREYLDVLFQGGIDLSKDDIRMTRSSYLAEYNKINEYFDKEKKKCQLNFLWAAVIFAFGLSVLIMIERLQLSINSEADGSEYLFMLLNGIRTGVFVANPVISGFFFISSIKSIKKNKISRKKALKRLEEKKQELMVLGLYDTAN